MSDMIAFFLELQHYRVPLCGALTWMSPTRRSGFHNHGLEEARLPDSDHRCHTSYNVMYSTCTVRHAP